LSWKDRISEFVVLTSPSGQVFNAIWRSATRQFNKKVGIFSYPDVNGTVTQDLKSDDFIFPLDLFFTGQDHDIVGAQFVQTLFAESGPWDVRHPVWGFQKLQLLSATETVDPVGNGNMTQVSTQWQKDSGESATISQAQSANEVIANIDNFNQSSISGFEDSVDISTAETRQSIITAARNIFSLSKSSLSELAKNDEDIFNLFSSIEAAFLNTINSPIFDPVAMVGQLINYIQVPVYAIDSIKVRISIYNDLLNQLLNFVIPDSSIESKNTALTNEIAAGSAVAGAILSSVSGELQNRNDSVLVIGSIISMFELMTNSFDNQQVLFNSSPIDLQYISQSTTYPQLFNSLFTAVRSLLNNSTNLKIEKIIILESQTSILTVCANSYGNLDNGTIDFFIETNDLHGNEILLLPAGREVSVFI